MMPRKASALQSIPAIALHDRSSCRRNRNKLISFCCALAVMPIGGANIALTQTAHFGGAQTALGSGFAYPAATAVDSSGNVYVADLANNVVKEILAVNGAVPASPTIRTLGSGFNFPGAVAVGRNGNVYVANTGDGTIKEMLAVNGGIPASPSIVTVTQIAQPQGVAVDASGNLYVSGGCQGSVPPGTRCGFVEEFLAVNGDVSANSSGPALPVSPSGPGGVAVDGNGNVYVADTGNNQVDEILAVNGSVTANSASRILISLAGPGGVAVDGSGDVFVSTPGTNAVYEVLAVNGSVPSPVTSNLIRTLGKGFNFPAGLSLDANGNLYVADVRNNRIVEISPSFGDFGSVNVGTTTSTNPLVFIFDTAGTLGSTALLTKGAVGLDFADAGTGTCVANTAYTAGQTCTINATFTPRLPGTRFGAAVLYGTTGNVLATAPLQGTGVGPQVNFLPGTQSMLGSGFNNPWGIAVDGAGNAYVADTNNNAVKEIFAVNGSIPPSPSIITLGSGFSAPKGVAIDGAGNVYVADTGHNAVKEIVAVKGGIPASPIIKSLGSFDGTECVAVDASGNVYTTQPFENEVEEIQAVNGVIPPSPSITSLGSGFNLPVGVVVDAAGDVYVADTGNGSVKEILAVNGAIPASPTINIIGSGFTSPTGLALDGYGNLFVSDFGANMLKEILAVNGSIPASPVIQTLATDLNTPFAVAVDGNVNAYVADMANNRILKVDVADPPSLAFANTPYGTTSLDSPQTITVENIGNAAATFPIPSIGNNPSISANFTLNSNATSACPLTTASSSTSGALAAGTSCQLLISFAPSTVGALNGSVVLTDNDLDAAAPSYASQAIALSGTGIQVTPTISWATPAAILYGTPLGTTQLDATSTVAGTFSYSAAAGTVLGVGPQALTATFTPTDTIDYANGTATVSLTVNPATPAITWAVPAGISYGTVLSTTQLNATASVAGTVSYSPAVGTTLSAGPQTLTATFTPTDSTDYTTATATVSLTVNQATPTISWPTPSAIPYGTPLNASQLNAASTVAGSFSYSPAAGAVLTAGSQMLTVTFTPTDTTDYTAATATVSLTVNKATPTISWPTPSAIPYGTPLNAAQLNAASTVAGSFSYSPAAGAVLTAGSQTLTVTFTPTDTTDYTTASSTVTLTVNKATPSITWPTPSAIPYGTPLNAAQLNAASTVAGSFSYSPAAGAVLNAGSQTLTATFTPTDAVDYTTATTSVTLVVNKATPAIAWATPAPITYGAALSATQLNASSTVAGTFTYSPAAGAVLNAGSQTLTATFTPTNTTDYTTATATVALVVNKVTPAITWAAPTAITQGTALSAKQLDATSNVAGTFTYSPAAGTVLGAGSQTLTTTFTPTNTTDYTTATDSVVLTVNPAPSFTVAASPASLSIAQGASGTSTITLTAKNGFSGSATLTASGLPSGVTASFSTNPTTGTSVLTLTASSTAAVGAATVTITGTSGSLTATTTVALAVTAKAGFACHVIYSITSQWQSGFGTSITIENTGTTAITNWTLTFAFANGQKVTQVWNGNESQSGANVTVTNMSYNGSIPTGGSYNGMGFNGSWNNITNAAPTSFTINGTVCK